MGTAGPRRPDLRRNVLNNFRIPVEKYPPARTDVLFDGARKAAVEPRKVNANDDVRFALERELKEPVKDAFELPIPFEGVSQADDRIFRQANRQLHARFRHPGSARAKKLRRERHRAGFR